MSKKSLKIILTCGKTLKHCEKRSRLFVLVPAHTIWLLSDNDVKARVEISRRFLRSLAGSLIGLEALQREESLSKAKLSAQVVKVREIERGLSTVGAKAMLSVHAPYTPIGKFDLASSSDDIRNDTIDAFVKCVELAETIGSKVVNAHLGGIISAANERDFRNPDAKRVVMERIESGLIDLTGRIEGRDVLFAVENVPYPLEEMPAYSPVVGIFPRDFSEILKKVDSKNLGVTVDFCHLWITYKTLREFLTVVDSRYSGRLIGADSYRGLTSYDVESIRSIADSPFEAFINPLCERIVHVHVADSDGTYVPETSSVSEGKPLGEGDLDLDGFADSLRQIERCWPSGKSIMIVVEPKEADLSKPFNSLKSLLRLNDLIRKKG